MKRPICLLFLLLLVFGINTSAEEYNPFMTIYFDFPYESKPDVLDYYDSRQINVVAPYKKKLVIFDAYESIHAVITPVEEDFVSRNLT
ncbi:MAG TPA: hypothetical protein PLV45_12460, partial [bacterium]|nr:hypothetical protein [bacterium]